MSKVRAGLIGLGAMGRNHARVLAAMDGVEFAAVHDPAFDDDTFAGVPALPSATALLEAGIDCCVIAAPTEHHEALATLAAERGVSVLVEKPLAADVEGAQRLAKLFAERGLIGAVGHIERFNPASIALKERIKEGVLGDIYQVATRRQGPFPARIRDVGVIMDLATHDIDLTQWVTDSKYQQLSAFTAHKSGREHEDLVVASGALSNGAVVSHHVNWISAAKERVTIVTGEGGTLVADTLNANLSFHENAEASNEWRAFEVFRGVGEGDVTHFALQRREPLLAELEAFRDAVLGHSSPYVPFSDGAEVVEVSSALIEASKSGAIVRFDAGQD